MRSDSGWTAADGAQPVIRLRRVSKSFAVYARPADRLRELFFGTCQHREYAALAPLDLDVAAGESLGIIGSNGAGKSTLMHLLAGSHMPSGGVLEVQGQVLGLLELGVGFHPEFTGRENIFFYADTLGLDRRRVRDKVSEIIDFSEIEAAIDQPIRTYSTGMRVRLAFALVASLDPDVLIVDEALAVGDLHFQKKCIDRMMSFRRAGKTIVFCSHSRYQIEQFCDRVLWLEGGQVRMLGTPSEVMQQYESWQLSRDVDSAIRRREESTQPAEPRDAPIRILECEIDSDLPLTQGCDLVIRWATEGLDSAEYHVSFSLKLESGRGMAVEGSQFSSMPAFVGPQSGRFVFRDLPFIAGIYSVQMRLWDREALVELDDRLIDGLEVSRQGAGLGILRLKSEWCPNAAAAKARLG